MTLKEGDVVSFERAFTVEDVEMFAKVSGDKGEHHIIPDEKGRIVIQGLLTATLPTKIGGDNNVLARTMNFEFIKPIFTGDKIICEVTIDKLEKKAKGSSIKASFSCGNQDGTEVMKGSFSGVIR